MADDTVPEAGFKVARFELPDGRIAKWQVPSDYTQEQAAKTFNDFMAVKGKPQFEKDTRAQQEHRELVGTTAADLIAANPMTRVATGAASPILGAMERFGLRSPEQRRELQAMQARGAKALGNETAGVVADISGQVMSPVWMRAAKMMPNATTMTGQMAQGSGMGALGGLLAETDDPMTTAGYGAGFGAAAPLLLRGAGKTFNTAANFMPNTRRQNFYASAAGDKADEIVDLLRRNEQIVPGSMPTAGQAAAPASRYEWSAIQAAAARGLPSEYGARVDEQSTAQLAQLRGIGKDRPALQAAETLRKTTTDPMYEATRTGGPLDVRPVVSQINTLLRENPGNPELVTELTAVKRGLLKGQYGAVRTDPQHISSSIDGLKTALANEKNKFIAGQLDDVKTALEQHLPGYEQAQSTFRDLSKPINRMQVGQYLEGVATPTGYAAGSGTPLSHQKFLEAVRKSTEVAGDDAAKRAAELFARRTTGSPRFRELVQILEPQEMKAVADVTADFARNRAYLDQAVKGAQNLPQFKETTKLPNLLMREAMVMNAIIGKAEGKINEKLAAEIAVEMLNPPKVAESLSAGMRRKAMNNARAETLGIWHKNVMGRATQAAGGDEQ